MKAALRRDFQSRRAALSDEERRRQSRSILARLRGLPGVRAARTLAGYHPLPYEVDDLEFLQEAATHGRRIALPRIDGTELSLHRWRPGDALEPGPFRVLEPASTSPTIDPGDAEVVLVPGLAFDRAGHRLGYGRGFYDRLLRRVPRPARVGLAFDLQVVDELPAEPHDVPLGWLVTVDEVRRFTDG